MNDYYHVNVPRDAQPTLEQAQDELHDELGVSPTMGETVAKLATKYVNEDTNE